MAWSGWSPDDRQFSESADERQAYILPLRLDGTSLPGFPPTIGYLDIRNSSVAEVCRLLVAKLGRPLTANAVTTREPSPESIETILRLSQSATGGLCSLGCRRSLIMRRCSLRCRSAVRLQPLVIYIEPEDNQRLVAGIIAELDLIERINQQPFTWEASGTAGTIDGAKLRIIHELSKNWPSRSVFRLFCRRRSLKNCSGVRATPTPPQRGTRHGRGGIEGVGDSKVENRYLSGCNAASGTVPIIALS